MCKARLRSIPKAEHVAERCTAIAPKAGYVLKVLTAQGRGAPGGRRSYLRGAPEAACAGGWASWRAGEPGEDLLSSEPA